MKMDAANCTPSAAAFGLSVASTSIISRRRRSRQGPGRCGLSHLNVANPKRLWPRLGSILGEPVDSTRMSGLYLIGRISGIGSV
jgi:hypothetical protein